jgi:hypothetical protein
MNNNHLYRQEYIRLLWVHSQQASSQSAKANEARSFMKLHHKRRIKSLSGGLGFFKSLYLRFRHLSEVREFNNTIEFERAKLISEQQEELRRLKASWEMQYSLSQIG